MNNSYILDTSNKLSDSENVIISLRKRETYLTSQITILDGICGSSSFSDIEKLIQDSRETIERKLLEESKKEVINTNELYRLQGQLTFARRYDFSRLLEQYRSELTSIKTQLKVYVKESAGGAAISS